MSGTATMAAGFPDLDPLPLSQDRIAVTFFADEFATRKHEVAVDLGALANRIHKTSKSAKVHLPWLKFARFGDVKTDKGSLRHDANVISISGVEGDYDGKMVNGRIISFKEAVATMQQAELSAVVYTSPSYTEDTQKWRILCPLSQEHPPCDRDHYMARLNGLFEGGFSSESFTLSQSYYFGMVGRNPSHAVMRTEGICIDQADWLDLSAIGRPKKPTTNGNVDPRSPAGVKPAPPAAQKIKGIVEHLPPLSGKQLWDHLCGVG